MSTRSRNESILSTGRWHEPEEISGSDNIIEGRAVRERIEYLESERDDVEADTYDTPEEHDAALADWDEEFGDELKKLRELDGDIGRDTTLINDTYFEDYARQLHADINGSDKEDTWPYSCIDWTAAADALKQDYTTLEWDGGTFHCRD
jgi:hypothetical protein